MTNEYYEIHNIPYSNVFDNPDSDYYVQKPNMLPWLLKKAANPNFRKHIDIKVELLRKITDYETKLFNATQRKMQNDNPQFEKPMDIGVFDPVKNAFYANLVEKRKQKNEKRRKKSPYDPEISKLSQEMREYYLRYLTNQPNASNFASNLRPDDIFIIKWVKTTI